MEYTVSKPFIYNGKAYGQGDTWVPSGHKVDKLIVSQRRVVAPAAPAPVKRGKQA